MKNYREQSHLPGTPVFDASGLLGAVISLFRNTRKSGVLAVLALAVPTLGILTPSYGQNVFNCPSGFTSTGACGVSFIGSGGEPFAVVGSPNGSTPALNGSQVGLIPTGATHNAIAVNYQTAVNVQAFSATFTFVPNGWNIAFVLQNNTNSNGGGTGKNFSAGAGCEGGFYQAFGTSPVWPNNIFALMLDQQGSLTAGGSTFTYSSVQTYQAQQTPCNPNDNQNPYLSPQNKISTSPISVNSPSGTPGTCVQTNSGTCDTWSETVAYAGTTVTLQLYDVTAGGSCPGSSCFTQTWNNVDIPALVGGNTAYVGLTGGTNEASNYPLLINSFTYTAGQTPAPPVDGQAVAVQVAK